LGPQLRILGRELHQTRHARFDLLLKDRRGGARGFVAEEAGGEKGDELLLINGSAAVLVRGAKLCKLPLGRAPPRLLLVELHKLVERHSAVAVGVCAHEARRRLPRLLSRCSLPRKLLREVLEQLRLRHAPAPVLVRCRELCELSPGRSLACMSLVVLRELLEGNSTVAVGVGAEEACSHRSRLCSHGVRRPGRNELFACSLDEGFSLRKERRGAGIHLLPR